MVKDRSMLREIRALKKQVKKGPVEKQGYVVTNHLADGHAGSVFKAEKGGQDYILKIMAPSAIPGRIMYKLFFQEEHGYFDKEAVNAAFWKRKAVNRITRHFDSDIDILDMTEQSTDYNGFYCPFIKHPSAQTPQQEKYVLEKTTKLKNYFNSLGLPSWSFNPDYPFYKNRKDNLRLNGDKLIIIDYESAVLTPSTDGYLDLDPVDFEKVRQHISENKQSLVDCLGSSDFEIMQDSLDKSEHYTQLWHQGEKRRIQRVKSKKELKKTIDSLIEDKILSEQEAEELDCNGLNAYIAKNLGVHLAIGCTAGLFTGPIPIGLFPRGLWTIGNRIYHEIKRNKEKAKVHSLGVLAWSSIPIPVLNYFGYLLPMKKLNETNALVYGEHLTRVLKGKSLGEYLERKPKFVQSMVKNAVVPKDKRKFYLISKKE
ncbi:hypothetical protein GOV14_02260 [Candidatus Pacearchaeota archaeon]|nr:hypothetical protein [Candidatus Pacearchaeota archaeon]